MNFRLFWKKESNECPSVVLGDKLCKAPFPQILASFPEDDIEEIVANNFSRVFSYHRRVDELHYYTLYPKWRVKIGEKLPRILSDFYSSSDIKTFVALFPQYTGDVYSFLLNAWLNSFFNTSLSTYEISFSDDILIPMSDLEKNNFYFPEIRKKALDIVKNIESYQEMWDVISILDNKFDIPRETFSEYLQNVYDDFILELRKKTYRKDGNPFTYVDFKKFKELFQDQEAYEYFMNALPELVSAMGIDLLSLLLKTVGPLPDVVNRFPYCTELSDISPLS